MLSPLYPVAFLFRPLRNNQPVFFAAGTRNQCTLHNQIDAQGVYVILGVQKMVFNR